MTRLLPWIVRTSFGEVELRVGSLVDRPLQPDPAELELRERALGHFLFDLDASRPEVVVALDQAFDALDGTAPNSVPRSAFGFEERRRVSELRARLRGEVENARLLLRIAPDLGPVPDLDPLSAELPPGEPRSVPETTKTFISLELRDQNDAPVPKRRFRVELPDKSSREGVTDEAGFATVSGFAQDGLAKITFLEFVDKDFKFEEALPGKRAPFTGPVFPGRAEADAAEKKEELLEIEIVDVDGQPLAGKPFKLTTQTGKVLEGELDDEGRAKLKGAKPGACLLVLP